MSRMTLGLANRGHPRRMKKQRPRLLASRSVIRMLAVRVWFLRRDASLFQLPFSNLFKRTFGRSLQYEIKLNVFDYLGTFLGTDFT